MHAEKAPSAPVKGTGQPDARTKITFDELAERLDRILAHPDLPEQHRPAILHWTNNHHANLRNAEDKPDQLNKLIKSLQDAGLWSLGDTNPQPADDRAAEAGKTPTAGIPATATIPNFDQEYGSAPAQGAGKPQPDFATARTFLAALGTDHTYQTFDDTKGRKLPSLVRVINGISEDTTLATLADLNTKGAGIFVTVNQTDGAGRKGENITRVRAIYADFDGPDAVERCEAAAAKLLPSIVVESSPGKRHAYWLCDTTIEAGSAAQRKMPEAAGCDPDAKDASRVLRIPGFYHRKGDPVRVNLLECYPDRRYELGQIVAAFGLDAIEAKAKTKAKADRASACVAVGSVGEDYDLLEYAINERDEHLLHAALSYMKPDGKRVFDPSDRSTWISVCGALAGSGEVGFRLFHEWSAEAGTDGGYVDEDDCRGKFDEMASTPKSRFPDIFAKAIAAGWVQRESSAQGFAEPAANDPRWKFKPLDMGKVMREDPKPINWLFHQRVPGNRGALLTGLGGTSKTQMLYQMAIAAILGHCPWGWEVDTTGKAVLILTEDDANDPHITIHTIKMAMGLNPEQCRKIEENLIVFPLAGEDLKLMIRDPDSGSLIESGHLRGFEEMIKVVGGVAFVGIDPALGVTEGDEASQSDQRALGRMADNLAVRCGCSVFILTHGTKGSLHSKEIGSHSSRGGGAITDAVRAEYGMRTMTPDEAEKYGVADIAERESYVQLKATKGNRIPPEAKVPVWFRRGRGGYLEVVELVEAQRGGISPLAKRVLDTLIEMDPDNNGERLQDWRHRCIEKGIIGGPTEDALKKAMGRAVNSIGNRIKKKDGERGVYQRNLASFDDLDEEDAA